jgi:hypothetical protein
MGFFEREFVREHRDFDMLSFSFAQTDSQPGNPDKEKLPKLFRPIKGIVENVTHDHLCKDDDNHSGEHCNDCDFFDFIEKCKDVETVFHLFIAQTGPKGTLRSPSYPDCFYCGIYCDPNRG